MSNWEIVPQEAKINKEDVIVDCKEISWRPSSPKEIASGSEAFKKLGTPTYRVLFKHVKFAGEFKVVAQHVKMMRHGKVVKVGDVTQMEWRVNMHWPDRIVKKQLMTRSRTTSVSIDCPSGATKIEKKSTGSSPFEPFFARVFPKCVRDEPVRILSESLLSEAIQERETVKKAA